MRKKMIKDFMRHLTGVEFNITFIDDTVFAEAEERTGIAVDEGIVVVGPKEATDSLKGYKLGAIRNIYDNVKD